VALSAVGATAIFADAAVGNGKPVQVNGLGLTGSAAPNYLLSEPTGLTASITSEGLVAGTLVAFSRATLDIAANGEQEISESVALPEGAVVERVVFHLEYSTYWDWSAVAGNYVRLNGVDVPGLGWASVGTGNGWQPMQSQYLGVLPQWNRSGPNLWRVGSAWNPVSLRNLTMTIHYWMPYVNKAPTDVMLSAAAIAENAGVNGVVGTLATVDPDATDSFTYSLVSGNGSVDNAVFELLGNQVRAKAGLDFETKGSYSIRVRTTDQGGLSFEKQFTIAVTDVNEAPTAVALGAGATTSLPENTSTAVRIKVADLVVTDDALGSETITLTGADAASFEVDGLALYLKSGVVLDFETKASYAVTVGVADTTLTGSTPVTVAYTLAVTDVNEISVLTITLDAASLLRSYTGSPQGVTWSTVPPNIPVRVTYNGSTNAPVIAGTYAVLAQSDDPKYVGQTNGVLVIRTTLESLRTEASLVASGLMPASSGDGRFALQASLGQAIAGAVPPAAAIRVDSGFWFADRLVESLGPTSNGMPTVAEAARGLMTLRSTDTQVGARSQANLRHPQMASGLRIPEARLTVVVPSGAAGVQVQVSGLPGARWKVQSSEGLPPRDWRDAGLLQLDGEGLGVFETSDDGQSATRFYRLAPP